jgi:hypothetical protein
LENGKVVGDAKNRALNLKLRSSQVSNPSQLGGYRQEDSFGGGPGIQREDFDSLKLDMVRELRDMKQSLKDATQINADLIRELKDMNMSLRQQQWQGAA